MSFIEESVINSCLAQIKQQLKEQGIAYADLAKHLQVSEITVKRMLNQNDIPFSRLITLANFTGIELGELIKTAQTELPKVTCFSTRQDQAFYDYPALFQYYIKLLEFSKSPAKVAKHYDLDDISTYLYLRALDDLELITLLPENKIQTPDTLFSFSAESKFMKRGITWSIEQAGTAFLDPENEDLNLGITFLHKEHCEELLKEMHKLIVKYKGHQVDLNWEHYQDEQIHQLMILSHPLKDGLPKIEMTRIKDGDLKLL